MQAIHVANLRFPHCSALSPAPLYVSSALAKHSFSMLCPCRTLPCYALRCLRPAMQSLSMPLRCCPLPCHAMPSLCDANLCTSVSGLAFAVLCCPLPCLAFAMLVRAQLCNALAMPLLCCSMFPFAMPSPCISWLRYAFALRLKAMPLLCFAPQSYAFAMLIFATPYSATPCLALRRIAPPSHAIATLILAMPLLCFSEPCNTLLCPCTSLLR